MSDGEIWLPVVGREDEYSVSSEGRVYSHVTNKVLSQMPARGGRLTVWLGRRNQRYVHHLVLEAFVAPRPPAPGNNGLHRNDIVTDNQPENLYWGTHSENMTDRIANGRHHLAIATHCKRGHEFTPENTYTRPHPEGRQHRQCRQCSRDYQREWKRAKRASASYDVWLRDGDPSPP